MKAWAKAFQKESNLCICKRNLRLTTMDSLVIPLVSSVAMGVFLGEVSKRHSDKTILMFLDQAGWHKARNLKLSENMILLSLPPYSPELNPTEHLWDEIREKWFGNITFNSILAVEERLVDGLFSLQNNSALIRSATGFNWIISID